jgi:hypothetical protein
MGDTQTPLGHLLSNQTVASISNRSSNVISLALNPEGQPWGRSAAKQRFRRRHYIVDAEHRRSVRNEGHDSWTLTIVVFARRKTARIEQSQLGEIEQHVVVHSQPGCVRIPRYDESIDEICD